ncbi:protein of unknown function (plasmid) [Caballeronia sp. S22]
MRTSVPPCRVPTVRRDDYAWLCSEKRFRIDVLVSEIARDRLVRDVSVAHVEAAAQMHVILHRAFPAFISQRERVAYGRVIQCERRRARDAARHICDAVMHDVIDEIDRIGMRSGMRGLEAATLIDCHVDDHRSLLHARDVLPCDELGRGCTGIRTPPITRSASNTASSILCALENAVVIRLPNTRSS